MATTIERLAVDLVANSAQFNREMARATTTADRWAQKTQRSIRTVATTFAASLGAGVSVAQITSYADAYTTVQNKIKQVTGTQQEFARANKDVFDIAVDTRSNLEAVATLYARTARQADTLGLSQKDVADFTKSVNLALNAYGATASEASSATLQLAQALGKGSLSGDEFRSVAEAAPPIMEAIAKEAGVAVGQLKEMGAAGEISADLIVRGVLRAKSEFEAGFAKSISTVSQALEVAATNTTAWVGQNQGLNAVLKASADSIVSLSKNLDSLAAVVETVAVVYGARLIASLSASTAAMVTNQIAAARAAAANAGYATSAGVVTAGATAAAVAVRGLNAGMAILGGPVGGALVAAYAVYQLASASESASDRMDRLETEAIQLNDALRNLSQAEIQSQIAAQSRSLGILEDKLRAAREEAERVSKTSLGGGTLGVSARDITAFTAANREVARLGDEVERTKSRITDLQQALVAPTSADTATAQTTNADLDKLTANLQRQVALYGEVSEAAKLRYEIESGAFEGSSVEQRSRALELAAQLDQKRAQEDAAEQAKQDQEQLSRIQAQNERVVSLQQEKFARLRDAALEATLTDAEYEKTRFGAEQVALEGELQRLRDRNLLTGELESQFQQAREDQRAIHEARLTEIEVGEAEKRLEAEEEIQKARAAILSNAFGIIAAAAKEGSAIQRAALVATKIIALNEARIEFARAVAKANGLGFPQNIPAIAQATAVGLNAISIIRGVSGAAHGGLDNVPAESTYLLDRGERVLSPRQNEDLTRFLAGGGGTAGVQVIINEAPGSLSKTVTQERDSAGNLVVIIDERIRQVVGADIASGRGLAGALQSTYGLRRVGTI